MITAGGFRLRRSFAICSRSSSTLNNACPCRTKARNRNVLPDPRHTYEKTVVRAFLKPARLALAPENPNRRGPAAA